MANYLIGTVWLIVCLGATAVDPASSAAGHAASGASDDDNIAFHVTRSGNDAFDGRTRETAFASLQRAVDALQPGQTLVIGPGEYSGAVTADHLGSLDADTVIRAEIPGTVLP